MGLFPYHTIYKILSQCETDVVPKPTMYNRSLSEKLHWVITYNLEIKVCILCHWLMRSFNTKITPPGHMLVFSAATKGSIIRNYSHNLGHLTPKLSLKVFQAQIEPILMYGSEVLFIGKEILDFETVHLSFLKNMLGVKQPTTSVTIYGDTGRYPLFLKQLIIALKYWIRLISLPRSCYLRIVYNSQASFDFIGETNWCSHIRSLLFRTNHRDVWENHRVENANRLIKQVKSCLIKTYKVDWSIKARNSIKLRKYIKFKFEHSLEEYLFYIPDTRWMKALSRLRMSSHMLEIERGRHVKPQKLPLEQRICQRCTSNSVDDDIHFLITCSYFATQRTSLLAESKLLNSEFDSLSTDDKFIYIMSSTHRPSVICLEKYTYSCFQTLSVSDTSIL